VFLNRVFQKGKKSMTYTENGHKSKKTGSGSSTRATGSVTLNDVAKLADVSPITVSRAINHPDKVAPKTLERISQAIARTGYFPNQLASGLASRRSHLIAAIVPTMANSVHAETISFFSERLRDSGYQVLLGETGYREDQEESLITTVLSRRPDGILLTGTNHSNLSRRLLITADIPVVETWDLSPTPIDVVIGFSHQQIGQAVAEFLLNRGYRHIGIVSAGDNRAKIRARAFIKTLVKRGNIETATSFVPQPTNFRLGREGLAHLLDSGFGEGAVFCSSDTLAQGALAEAQSRGLLIPDQLAIIGLGDQPYAAYTYPALTTVRFDREIMGRRAAEALLARINGEPVTESYIDIGFTILERQTT